MDEEMLRKDYVKMISWGYTPEMAQASLEYDVWLYEQLCKCDPSEWVDN